MSPETRSPAGAEASGDGVPAREFDRAARDDFERFQERRRRDWARTLFLAGAIVFPLFYGWDLLLGSRSPWLSLAVRIGTGLLLFGLWRLSLWPRAREWIGVLAILYLGLLSTAIAVAASLVEAGFAWALPAFTLFPAVGAPFWRRPGELATGLIAVLLPPLVALGLAGAAAVVWVNYLAYGAMAATLGVLIFLLGRRSQRKSYLVQRALAHRAWIDPLTGLFTRAAWRTLAGDALVAAAMQKQPLTALFIDVDRFKAVNDAHGHDAGDRVLAEVAARIAGGTRERDLVGRFGGEELVVLLWGLEAPEATMVAERLREAVAASPVTGLELTLSIGLAHWNGSEALDELLQRADLAVLQAKRQGRNRVVAAH